MQQPFFVVLQPRIFVLLRRCLFDSDDEVSICILLEIWKVKCLYLMNYVPSAFLIYQKRF